MRVKFYYIRNKFVHRKLCKFKCQRDTSYDISMLFYQDGDTPLIVATIKNRVEAASLLLNMGAQESLADKVC